MTTVYVKDNVLDLYEKRPELYDVHPDTGGVSYKGQWSVSYCRRIGRDFIQLEIRKLYEGTPQEVIEHWHKHAVVLPTKANFDDLSVAKRAKRIVFGLAKLGEFLSCVAAEFGNMSESSKHFVSLDRRQLTQHWWYADSVIRPITQRIPLELSEIEFRDRCESLAKLVIEGLKPAPLRKLLEACKVVPCEGGSLKLLDQLIQLVTIALEQGLDLRHDMSNIERHYNEQRAQLSQGQFLPTPIEYLFRLYDIRIHAAHRGTKPVDIYRTVGTTPAATITGWGEQLDRVYDNIGDAIDRACAVFRNFLKP